MTILPPGTFTQVPPASLPIDLSTKTTFGSAGWNYYFTSSSVYDMPVDALVTEVPEPFTWAMMLVGFAGLGFAGYRSTRRRAGLAWA